MKKRPAFILCSMIVATAVPAWAHEGPRIWIGNDAGSIRTYTSDDDVNPSVYTPSRLFTTELVEFFGIFTNEFPGYEVRQDGGNVDSGETFGFNITGPLLYYDDSGGIFVPVQEQFGPPAPGPIPQMAVSEGSQIRVTDAGAVGGFDFFTFNEVGDHSHLAYTLFGNGINASDGPSGVYALSLELTSDTLLTSETYFLLIGKDVSRTDPLFLEAIAVAEATLVSDVIAGDMDCSGTLDEDDIEPFVLAQISSDSYIAAHPSCDLLHGDMNNDELVNGGDMQGFVDALID